jgi:hypothetical protein
MYSLEKLVGEQKLRIQLTTELRLVMFSSLD